MLRSRLKNIINKSNTISKKQEVGNPFDEFKKSLPIEIDDNYRLEAAWKAYGSPKDYKTALWYGMIQPIDKTNVKLPSIGYNEETDEYEYLNKGEDNETVAKDIRVWDNDVIPLVQELKLGGYVRTFNKEKDCWTYTKNSQKEDTLDLKGSSIRQELNQQDVEYLKNGGKNKRNKTDLIIYANQSGVPFMKRILNNDLRKLDLGNGNFGTHLLRYDSKDGKTYVFPQILEDPAGNLWNYKDGTDAFDRALEQNNVLEMTPEEAEWFTTNYKWFYPNYFGSNPYPNSPQAFKQGGQMSVIPEGALHARKNEMELAKEGTITHKGIPVVDNKGELQAEIERNEIIFRKQVTDKMEELYKKYNETDSQSKKDDIAVEMGKIITCEITKHTEDRTGLIEQVLEEM